MRHFSSNIAVNFFMPNMRHQLLLTCFSTLWILVVTADLGEEEKEEYRNYVEDELVKVGVPPGRAHIRHKDIQVRSFSICQHKTKYCSKYHPYR